MDLAASLTMTRPERGDTSSHDNSTLQLIMHVIDKNKDLGHLMNLCSVSRAILHHVREERGKRERKKASSYLRQCETNDSIL